MFNKESLIRSFEAMREIEISGRDYYSKLKDDSDCQKAGFDNRFEEIARDEENHSQIIEKVINIIKNNL